MTLNMYPYNSTNELDRMMTAEVTTNATVKQVLRQSEDHLHILYLANVTRMMWTYVAPVLLLTGTAGNITSAIIMLRYVQNKILIIMSEMP